MIPGGNDDDSCCGRGNRDSPLTFSRVHDEYYHSLSSADVPADVAPNDSALTT